MTFDEIMNPSLHQNQFLEETARRFLVFPKAQKNYLSFKLPLKESHLLILSYSHHFLQNTLSYHFPNITKNKKVDPFFYIIFLKDSTSTKVSNTSTMLFSNDILIYHIFHHIFFKLKFDILLDQ